MHFPNPFKPTKPRTHKTHPAPLTQGRPPSRPRAQKIQLSKPDFSQWVKSTTHTIDLPDSSQLLVDPRPFYKRYYALMTRAIPIVSDAVWVWTNLCATNTKTMFIGGTDASRDKARQATNALAARLSPFPSQKSHGFHSLIRTWFRTLFTYARVSGQLVVPPTVSEVSTFKLTDPFQISFDKNNYELYHSPQPGTYHKLNTHTAYYYALNQTTDNPYGTHMLDAANTLIGIANDMINDMALSSSNAGIPRLHIKITPPQQADTEDDEDYRNRISDYFQNTVADFADIAPDDNIYSWDDVQVSVAGGSQAPGAFVWKSNRSVVEEEVVAAFHLYPWILGKSFSTTKNWVQAQYNVLMQQVKALQIEAAGFLDWIINTNLLLSGIHDVHANSSFDTMRDPSTKDFAIAERFQINNAKTKTLAGIISPDDAARELGYDKAHDPDRIYRMQKEKEDEPVNKENADTMEILDKLSIIEDKLQTINPNSGE